MKGKKSKERLPFAVAAVSRLATAEAKDGASDGVLCLLLLSPL
jgi:hypothetical protein